MRGISSIRRSLSGCGWRQTRGRRSHCAAAAERHKIERAAAAAGKRQRAAAEEARGGAESISYPRLAVAAFPLLL